MTISFLLLDSCYFARSSPRQQHCQSEQQQQTGQQHQTGHQQQLGPHNVGSDDVFCPAALASYLRPLENTQLDAINHDSHGEAGDDTTTATSDIPTKDASEDEQHHDPRSCLGQKRAVSNSDDSSKTASSKKPKSRSGV
jgi:hypothetical protein